jgi:hypothetical protein
MKSPSWKPNWKKRDEKLRNSLSRETEDDFLASLEPDTDSDL